jgi:hypothetical protein
MKLPGVAEVARRHVVQLITPDPSIRMLARNDCAKPPSSCLLV